MTEILTTLADIPAIDPYRTKIAVDPGFYCLVPEETRNEAAAEIERLTAENGDLKERLAAALDALGRISALLGAENERLRAALEPFAKAGQSRSAKTLDIIGAFSELSLGDLGRAARAYQQLSVNSEKEK